jgi:hypothetical protein
MVTINYVPQVMSSAAVAFFGSAYLIFFSNRPHSEVFTTIYYDRDELRSGRRRELDDGKQISRSAFPDDAKC